LHERQAVVPFSELNDPKIHSEQKEEPEKENFPSLHAVQLDDRVRLYFPASQKEHFEFRIEDEYVPAGHCMQLLLS
jgi:hypothetical protein